MNEMEFHEEKRTFCGKSAYEKIRRLYDFDNGKKMRILDIGCGNGVLDEYLAEWGHEVVGLDAYPDEKEDGRRYLRIGQDLSAKWQVSENSFDMVICTDVVEHLYNPIHVLRQSESVLKSDGMLIMGIPNHFDLRQRLRMLFGKGIIHWDNLGYGQYSWNYAHIRFFTFSDFMEMFRISGWRPELIQLNFMGAGIVPTRFTPRSIRFGLLMLLPGIFSGKFIFLARKSKESDGGNPAEPRRIHIPFTPKGF